MEVDANKALFLQELMRDGCAGRERMGAYVAPSVCGSARAETIKCLVMTNVIPRIRAVRTSEGKVLSKNQNKTGGGWGQR